MFDPAAYAIAVRRTVVDGETLFEATLKEFPHVRGYGESSSEAYEQVIDAIEGLYEMAVKDGLPFPSPLVEADAEYSGRVTLRLPSALHRSVAVAAAQQGTSLNQFLVAVIGFASASASAFFNQPTRMRNVAVHPTMEPILVPRRVVSLTWKGLAATGDALAKRGGDSLSVGSGTNANDAMWVYEGGRA